MTYFKPYDVYATRMPVLKPGHMIRVADKYYMVTTVRRNRKKVAVTGAKTEAYRFKTETSSEFTPMVGNLNLNRIVHLQYVAIDVDTDTKFYWGTQPLLSKDREEALQTWGANLLAPLELDRWSFDEAMHLHIQQAASQNYYLEILEYEVVPYAGTPTRPFLHIMGNGQAIFVESPGVEQTLGQINAAMIAQAKKKA